jgi:CheY-like chemotaxis protein/HPt (histidine-containing phosphotransfer) domain-containing protein
MSELALREEIPSAAFEQITTIKHAGGNLLSIINDILDFSKIESGKLEIVPANYSLSSLIHDVVSIIRLRLDESNVRFVSDIDSSIPNMLYGDEVRIRQILLNILNNAVKYTPKGFISLDVRGDVSEDTVNLYFEVSDTGTGIKEEDLGRLFGDFVQLDLSIHKGVEGTGLGLAITHNLVKAMGGEIIVASEYGHGSTFIVTLPQMICTSEQSASDENPAEEPFTAPDARVLIVDDIDTNLKVAEGLLQPYQMKTDLCKSGASAIAAVQENRYDLVFLDHMMPEMDGIETISHIRALGGLHETLPVIALTANAVTGTREMFLRSGFNDFLSKPIDTDQLNAILTQWIPKQKQHKAEDPAAAKEPSNGNPVIHGLDVQQGIRLTGGTLKSYLRTLAAFHSDGTEKVGQIRECLETGDLRLYTIYTHSIKGAAAIIGANALSETAKALEMAGKNEDMAFIRTHTDRFLANLDTVLDNVAQALLSMKEQTSPGDIVTMKDGLARLKEALDALDSESIDRALEDLQPFVSTDGVGAVVQKILENTWVGEYDGAVELIDRVLEDP